jgi:GNAT superfamily N-acetyltransferase
MDRKSYAIRPVNKDDRAWIVGLLEEHWGSTTTVSRGNIHHADRLPGFAAIYQDRPAGLITYNIEGDQCEITSMNSLTEGIGIGLALVDAVRNTAVKAGCRRLWLITTNDNTAALRFWQKRGFMLAVVYRNAMEASRRLKPEIPLTGNDGIPIRDEIELEMIL